MGRLAFRVAARSVALTTLLLSLVVTGQAAPRHLGWPAGVRQVLLVRSETPEATVGRLSRWERVDKDGSAAWCRVPGSIEVSLGRSGMGWGLGLHAQRSPGGPLKREGDGRSPAGIFALGPAFGYDVAAPPGGRGFPYRQATEVDLFVDDARSRDYNTWVRAPRRSAPERRWGSFERMRRPDELYALGVVVQHNAVRPVPGAGSAIFIHVWSAPGATTAGCTAMRLEDVEAVVGWLSPDDEPVLVQGWTAAFRQMAYHPAARPRTRSAGVRLLRAPGFWPARGR